MYNNLTSLIFEFFSVYDRDMLKKLIFSFAVISSLFLLSGSISIFAQVAPIVITAETAGVNQDPLTIDGATDNITITFNGLDPDLKYYLCLRTDSCAAAQLKGSKLDELDKKNPVLKLCGDGGSQLKKAGAQGCSKNDYFHEGKIYRVTLYLDDKTQVPDVVAAFFVNYFFPKVDILPEKPNERSGPLKVSISGTRKPHTKGQRNNYQVVVEGVDQFGGKYKEDKCITVREGGTATAEFERGKGLGLGAGSYIVKIKEHVQENNEWKPDFDHDCTGGFTFYHYQVKIGLRDEAGSVSEAIKDPNGVNIEGLNKLIGVFSKVPMLNLRCDKGERVGSVYSCLEINTAIGPIPTNPIAFIQRIFSIILSIAGIAALGLLIYGGYVYMISRGDPERIKGARETITSAIVGLLFIIFSLVILQVIAGDILRIPGFNAP